MLFLLCLTVACVQVRGQADAPPPSPCPDVFRYSYDSGQWSGFLKVAVPEDAKRMIVVASLFVIDVLLPPEYPGELQLVQDERTVKEQIWSHQINKVDYLLELPVQSPLPVIDKIKINSKVICEGPKVKARNRTKVSYTHRLNGLRQPKPNKPVDQSDMKQGRMLGEAEKPGNRFHQQGKKEGGKGKDTLYNKLELMENEVVKEMVQEDDVFPKIQGRSEIEEDEEDEENLYGREPESVDADSGDESVDAISGVETEYGEEDEEDFPDNLSPKGDAISGDETEYDEENEEDEEDFPDKLDPKGDAEVVDIPKVQTTKSVKKPDPNLDADLEDDEEDDDEDSYEGENSSDILLNPDEDAEMLDNKIPNVGMFNLRKPDPNFKRKLNSEDVEEFSSDEFDDDNDDDDFDNEINPDDGTKPRVRPNPKKRGPGFKPRARGVMYPGEFP